MRIVDIVWEMVNQNLPGNEFLALDGNVYEFPFSEAVALAHSGHEAIFKLNRDYGWGVPWYALHRVGSCYIFTVGHGYWHQRREVPVELVPALLRRYFNRSEVTDEGKALLK